MVNLDPEEEANGPTETSESLFHRQEWAECLASLSNPEEPAQLANRALLYLKVGQFKEATLDARRLLSHQANEMRVRGWRIILAAAAASQNLDRVEKVLKAWEESAPTSSEMMSSRTLMRGLMAAIEKGIEMSAAFSGIENALDIPSEWLSTKIWKHRALPSATQPNFTLCLKFRFGTCELDKNCPDAHGEGEITEWNERRSLLDELGTEIVENTQSVLLREMRDSVGDDDGNSFPSGVKAKCSQPLIVDSLTHKNFAWKFSIESESALTQIGLLDDTYRQHFSIANAHYNSKPKTNLISDLSDKTQLVEVSHREGKKGKAFTYSVAIQFKSEVFGKFHQRVLFNSARSGRSVQSISINLIKETEGSRKRQAKNQESILSSTPTWHCGNANILDGVTGEKVKSTLIGFPLLPSRITPKNEDKLSMENYVDKMRSFLTEEEKARQGILSKYNLSTKLKMDDKFNMGITGETRYAAHDSLYGQLKLFRDVSEDTAVGRLILRGCTNVLLCKSEDARNASEANELPTVFLCPIVDKSKNVLHVEMGPDIVNQLDLTKDMVAAFDVQFQLDRTAFGEQKGVLEKLQSHHLGALFPDCSDIVPIPWHPHLQWNEDVGNSEYELNPRQKEAFIAITTKADNIPPILLVGPFGTGKTFTLAKCIHKLVREEENRILICTHSNSAADLYIKEYAKDWTSEISQVLRVYYTGRALNTVHPRVKAHCLIVDGSIRTPTLQNVMDAKVVVVTLSTSLYLLELSLPEDTFTHIFLDEAAQAMEAEAVLPLASAGPLTRIVLAGDHLQLSPELFSTGGRELEGSLLERLHALYMKAKDTHPCNLLLNKNYRSHSAIVSFASNAFYKRRLECAREQPAHDVFYPLTLFTARGEEAQDEDSTSYYNLSEVYEVVERVKKLLKDWPESWGDKRNEASIGVLTPYADQVTKIRSQLRICGLHHVSVERVFNVQGKQFRAVFLSTVRSHKPWVRILPEAVGAEVDLGFFSNPKLLNTALTRAQSLVAVVGDPVSLLSIGKCRKLWEDFVKIVNEKKSLYGITFEDMKKNIEGIELRLTWGLNPLASEFTPKTNNTLTTLDNTENEGEIVEEEKKITQPMFPPKPPQQLMMNSHEAFVGPPIQQVEFQPRPLMKLIQPPQIQQPLFVYNRPIFPQHMNHVSVPPSAPMQPRPGPINRDPKLAYPFIQPQMQFGKEKLTPISSHSHGLMPPMAIPQPPTPPQFFQPPPFTHPDVVYISNQKYSQPGPYQPSPNTLVRQHQMSPVQPMSLSPFQSQMPMQQIQPTPQQFYLIATRAQRLPPPPQHPSVQQAYHAERTRLPTPLVAPYPPQPIHRPISNNNNSVNSMGRPMGQPSSSTLGPSTDDYSRIPEVNPVFMNSVIKAYMNKSIPEPGNQTEFVNQRRPQNDGDSGWRAVGKEKSAWTSQHHPQMAQMPDRRPVPLMSMTIQPECKSNSSSSVPSYANIVKKGTRPQMNGNHSNGYH